jgi:hypothetical protein
MIIKPSTRAGKRFMVTFANGKTVHFGAAGGRTYIDHGDEKKKNAYIARHGASKREDWSNPYSAGAISRWLLWGKYKTLGENHTDFMRRFPGVN